MSEAEEKGWTAIIEDDMSDVPNDCFDVIAKYYDAGFDRFMMARIPGCVKVDGRIIWGSPFPGDTMRPIDLMSCGYRPTHWSRIPKPLSDTEKTG